MHIIGNFEINSPKIKGKTQQKDYKIKHSHIQNFTLKMLIIEWTTVTFCSASLLTNKYREGGLFFENALHFTSMVCLYTHKFGFGIRFDPNIKRKWCRKSIKQEKKISMRGRLLDCLSKIPDTVCLRATALCAVHALAV